MSINEKITETATQTKVVVERGSPGLFTVFVILLILKCANVAGMSTLSWWLVFLPIYIVPAIFFGVIGLIIAGFVIAGLCFVAWLLIVFLIENAPWAQTPRQKMLKKIRDKK